MVNVALMAWLIACQAAFWSIAGGAASVRYTIAETGLPSPGGWATDLTRSLGNLKKAASRPCASPARSGFGPLNGTYVGSRTPAMVTPPPAAAGAGVPPEAGGFAAEPAPAVGEGCADGVHAACSRSGMPIAPAAAPRPAHSMNLR